MHFNFGLVGMDMSFVFSIMSDTLVDRVESSELTDFIEKQEAQLFTGNKGISFTCCPPENPTGEEERVILGFPEE